MTDGFFISIHSECSKKWVSYLYRTAQPSTLAAFPPWGSQQELVVQDLPVTKVVN